MYSGSSFIVIFGLLFTIFLIFIVHMIFIFVKAMINHFTENEKIEATLNHLYYIFTFHVYIRFILESGLFVAIAISFEVFHKRENA